MSVIFETRREGESNSAIVNRFNKRYRKANTRARATKTQTLVKKDSKLRRKRKALSRLAYEAKKQLQEKTAKI